MFGMNNLKNGLSEIAADMATLLRYISIWTLLTSVDSLALLNNDYRNI